MTKQTVYLTSASIFICGAIASALAGVVAGVVVCLSMACVSILLNSLDN